MLFNYRNQSGTEDKIERHNFSSSSRFDCTRNGKCSRAGNGDNLPFLCEFITITVMIYHLILYMSFF